MNKYRILLLFGSDESLDTKEIRKRMMAHGLSNIQIEEGQPVGKRLSLIFYFDSDIPISLMMHRN